MSTSATIGWRAAYFAAAFLIFVLTPIAHAKSASAELQKIVRSATFEVVVRKPETDPLTYEKPLPLDLLPFIERNDKFWSVGTAFAVGPNLFVSAAHVMEAGNGQFGTPLLRDSKGDIYEIDSVEKFSLHEDFMAFTLVRPPAITPLAAHQTPEIDDEVFAVGNALGEGVVIRDGLLTSMTSEEQDGRWKWLRFSAAASPGNSGGPLLDARGKVLGVVTARSPGENLNYALPIGRVLNDFTGKANIDVRSSFEFPVLADPEVSVYRDSFDLPLKFAEFGRKLQSSRLDHYLRGRDQILATPAAEIYPGGKSAKLLSAEDFPREPTVLAQKDDQTWEAEFGEGEEVELAGDGAILLRYARGLGLFMLKRPNSVNDEAFYAESRAFMELMLKALKLTRPIGSQEIRITSMGPAVRELNFVDRHGRDWQWRVWPMRFADMDVHAYALPTPEGYAGFVRFAPTSQRELIRAESEGLAAFVQVPYRGTLSQWQLFLERPSLRPKAFHGWRFSFEPKEGFRFGSSRFEVNVPQSLLKLTDSGVLRLDMVLMPDGSKLIWDVGRMFVSTDDDWKRVVTTRRHAKPAVGAGKEAHTRWEDLQNGKGEFGGVPGHDQDFKAFWVTLPAAIHSEARLAVDQPINVRYDLGFRTDQSMLPREFELVKAELVKAVRVLEQ